MIGIRKVVPEEVSILQRMAIQTFHETFASANSPEVLADFFKASYSLGKLRDEIRNPETELCFLTLKNEPIGYIQLNLGGAQTEQVLENAIEIQRFYLLKAHQGKGLGKFLFDYAMQFAELSGKKWIWLGVWENNTKAQNFYHKNGFEKFSEHHFQIGEKIDTDWLMKKALR